MYTDYVFLTLSRMILSLHCRGLPGRCCKSWLCRFFLRGGYSEPPEGSCPQGVVEFHHLASQWCLSLSVHVSSLNNRNLFHNLYLTTHQFCDLGLWNTHWPCTVRGKARILQGNLGLIMCAIIFVMATLTNIK